MVRILCDLGQGTVTAWVFRPRRDWSTPWPRTRRLREGLSKAIARHLPPLLFSQHPARPRRPTSIRSTGKPRIVCASRWWMRSPAKRGQGRQGRDEVSKAKHVKIACTGRGYVCRRRSRNHGSKMQRHLAMRFSRCCPRGKLGRMQSGLAVLGPFLYSPQTQTRNGSSVGVCLIQPRSAC
jgi:hypothetical protein